MMRRGPGIYDTPKAEVLFLESEKAFTSDVHGGTEPYTKEDVDPGFE